MKISSSPETTASFVSQVQEIADANRALFGFVPAPAYSDAASQAKLLVAHSDNDLIGYLWFGGTYPSLRVFQIYVSPTCRTRGVGTALMDELKARADQEQYQFIRAKILLNNEQAHEFYDKQGFELAPRHPGSSNSASWRVFEVPTLKLFATHTTRGLNLPSLTFPNERCLLDCNVVVDMSRNRPNTASAVRLLAAAHKSRLSLVVSSETKRELGRGQVSIGPSDAAWDLCNSLPSLSAPPRDRYIVLQRDLQGAIFPERTRSDTLTSRDLSDIAQILTAYHHQVRNLITNDNALLRARSSILELTGVYVSAPSELLEPVESPSKPDNLSRHGEMSISIQSGQSWSSDDVEARVSELLGSAVERVQISSWIVDHREHLTLIGMESDGECIALGAWPSEPSRHEPTQLVLLASAHHPNALIGIEALSNFACQALSAYAPAVLETAASSLPVQARSILRKSGWRRTGSKLRKHCVGRILTAKSWAREMAALEQRGGPKVTKHCPQSESAFVELAFTDGATEAISCIDLESLFSNVLVLFRSRGGVILPIQKEWSSELLAADRQMRLLGRMPNSSMSQRVYFRSTTRSHHFTPGRILLFYESGKRGGQQAVVAMGRCTAQREITKGDIPASVSSQGVLDETQLQRLAPNSDTISAVHFDNVFTLRRPVTFSELRKMDAVDGANLVTAHPIGGDKVMAIWKRSEER